MSIKIQKKDFLDRFLADYKVAAISPSSHFLLKKIIKQLHTPLECVVEHGAGDGVMTLEILRKLSPTGTLILVEQNNEFLNHLRAINDPRIVVVDGLSQEFNYATYIPKGKKPDLILASIPFSFLNVAERERICKDAHDNLTPSGEFIIFHQYSTLMKDTVKKFFGAPNVTFILWNIFPCFIIKAKK